MKKKGSNSVFERCPTTIFQLSLLKINHDYGICNEGVESSAIAIEILQKVYQNAELSYTSSE